MKQSVTMKSGTYCIVDIGGTKILLCLIDDKGNMLYRKKTSTPEPATPEAVIKAMSSTLNQAWSDTGKLADTRPDGLGVSIAAFVDYKKGIVHQAPNLYWKGPVNFGSMLKNAFNCPVQIENDTNAAVLGETFFGAARGHNNVIYITISTGIGAGFYLDNRLYRGNDGFAGEIGHTKAFGQGRTCNCGGEDCLEAWASGSAMESIASAIWNEAEEGGPIDTPFLFKKAEQGNLKAQAIIDNGVISIGRGLSNLVTLLNPSCMVIGGGIASNRPEYFEQLIKNIKKKAIRPAVEVTPLQIVKAELEPESGIWGSYALITGLAI